MRAKAARALLVLVAIASAIVIVFSRVASPTGSLARGACAAGAANVKASLDIAALAHKWISRIFSKKSRRRNFLDIKRILS
jgi:hypothetical protein